MPFEVRGLLDALRWLEAEFATRKWRIGANSAFRRALVTLDNWSEKRAGAIASIDELIDALEVADLAVQIRHHQLRWSAFEKGVRDLASATQPSDSTRLLSPDDPSHRLFELRMALAAADVADDAQLAEPDVRFSYGDLTCLMACKVVHGAPGKLSTAQYRDKVDEGLRQLARQVDMERDRVPERNIQCLVAVSLRNHVDHSRFRPPAGEGRIERLSTAETVDRVQAETERFARELEEGGDRSAALHVEKLAFDFSHEKSVQVGLIHYQGSVFVNEASGNFSPFRRLWSRWVLPIDLLENLHVGIQYGDQPPSASPSQKERSIE